MFGMKRREFIALLGGAAAAWPFAARAQQGERVRRIGVLMSYPESDNEYQGYVAAFREGLQKLGWTEGRNIEIRVRWGAVDAELRQQFAKALVALQPDLILTQNTPTTSAILQQTRTIPVVFVQVADPVGSGFVANLPRPAGNTTGFTNLEGSMAGKWLELLREIAPRIDRVASLFNPATAPYAEYFLIPFRAAAASFAVEATAAPVRDTSTLETLIAAQARAPNGGLIVLPDTFTSAHRSEITSLAARYQRHNGGSLVPPLMVRAGCRFNGAGPLSSPCLTGQSQLYMRDTMTSRAQQTQIAQTCLARSLLQRTLVMDIEQ